MSATTDSDCIPIPEMQDQDGDRRRSTRVACNVSVKLRASDGRDIEATCLDINQNGVGIETHNQLSVGQRLELLVSKQNGEVTPVPMLVMFRMNTHYGLAVLDGQRHILDLIPTQA